MTYTHDDVEDALEVADLVAKFYKSLKKEEKYNPAIISNTLIKIGLEITIHEIFCCEEMDTHERSKVLLLLKSQIFNQFQKSVDAYIYKINQNDV